MKRDKGYAMATRSGGGLARDNARTRIERIDRVVYLLDELFRIPIINKRVGLDPIIGLVPWAGDIIGTGLGLYIIFSALWFRLPKVIVLRMGLNVIFDAVIGMIPFVGDVTDFFIRANRWNLNLLKEYAGEYRRPGFGDYLFVGFVLSLVIAILMLIIWVIWGTIMAGIGIVGGIGLV
ncbi:MAG: DUF4112 domain-containing protein [Blastocatellia bacterium]